LSDIEARIEELRAERGHRQALAARADVTQDVRERRITLDVSQKPALLFEALHAVTGSRPLRLGPQAQHAVLDDARRGVAVPLP
jgi:hypothetical protein